MDTLQTVIHRSIEELPRQLLKYLLRQKLRVEGIRLSEHKVGSLTDRILAEKLDAFDFDDGTEGGRVRNIAIEFTDADSEWMEERFRKFMDRLPSLIVDLTDKTSRQVLSSLKKKWRTEFQAQQRDLDKFQKRLEKRWRVGLDKLRMLISIAREYGSELNNSVVKLANRDSSQAFDVLIKLHARSCQVASEIACLLSNGFADGAMARWRTLHEIVAVGYLIQRYGDELAERYIDHQIVESRKAALQYDRFHSRLRQSRLSKGTLRRIEADYNLLIKKYGDDFANSQGWAAKHIGKPNPTFADIQEAAGIDHLAPYYRMASHNVHANPKGVFFKLGLIGDTNILLAGPSDAGLADPGHATALSLVQTSSQLLSFHPTIDFQVVMKVMEALEDEIGASLLAAHKKLDTHILRNRAPESVCDE